MQHIHVGKGYGMGANFPRFNVSESGPIFTFEILGER
jgi:hypothetical protein